MSDYELAILLDLQDHEYLREQWFNIIHNHIIYVNSKEIKRILLEEISNDWELFFTYYRYREYVDKAIKLLSDDLRRNGVRYVSKYVIPDLFKKILKEFLVAEYVRKNQHRLYSMRKRQRIKLEHKFFYAK